MCMYVCVCVCMYVFVSKYIKFLNTPYAYQLTGPKSDSYSTSILLIPSSY